MGTRLNDKRHCPNDKFTFFSTLNGWANQADAYKMLECLAAQVKPIMREHGFKVRSLEEYPPNKQFWGRNWNGGEVIELVLRRHNGGFLPYQMVICVLCHELAHCVHMNHGTGFQKLNNELRNEVKELQMRGYFGDGFYSSGRHLGTGSRVTGDVQIQLQDMPELICGGTRTREKKSTLKTCKKGKRKFSSKPRKKRKQRIKGAFSGHGYSMMNCENTETLNQTILGTSKTTSETGKKSRKKWAHSRAEIQARLDAIQNRLKEQSMKNNTNKEQGNQVEDDYEGSSEEQDDSDDLSDEDLYDILDNYTPSADDKKLAEIEKQSLLGFAMPITEQSKTELSSCPSSKMEPSKVKNNGLSNLTDSTNEIFSVDVPVDVPVSEKIKIPSVIDKVDNESSMNDVTRIYSNDVIWVCFCTTENHVDYGLCQICGTRRVDAEKALLNSA